MVLPAPIREQGAREWHALDEVGSRQVDRVLGSHGLQQRCLTMWDLRARRTLAHSLRADSQSLAACVRSPLTIVSNEAEASE